MEDRCVMCDEIVPEGTHVCPTCRKRTENMQSKIDELVLINGALKHRVKILEDLLKEKK